MKKKLNYSIIETLSDTACVTIYRAKEADSNSIVTIKQINKKNCKESDFARFKHNFENFKNIESQFLYEITNTIETDEYLKIIFEDFKGTSFREFSFIDNKKFDLSLFLKVAINISEALGFCHSKNIIHADLKPDKIFIDENLSIKIKDFGFENIFNEDLSLYDEDILKNHLPYISPEQTGRMNRQVDFQSDLYTLGIIFYEKLCGVLPFKSGDPMELIHFHMAKEPLQLSEINNEIPLVLSNIVVKLLSKIPENRYLGGYGLKQDLEKCLHSYISKGEVENFKLGEEDVSDIFKIPEKLYGRDDDVKILLECYDRVKLGLNEVIIISGSPGTGKTVLVNEIYKPVSEEKGYYISGKFEQFLKDRPYSAIIQAYTNLISQILSESEERINYWKNKIMDAMGPNGQVIIDVIPKLELIIGPQPEVPVIGVGESQNRFKMYFLKFISIFSEKGQPLVLFLDDLQWADIASLQLIKRLLTSSEMDHLLLIGAYRNIDINTSHPLTTTIDELITYNIDIHNIHLDNLSEDAVKELIMATLNCTEEDVRDITEVVVEKTAGNPFFVKELLKLLYSRNILMFDYNIGWHWDISEVDEIQASENVIALMTYRLSRLSVGTQDVLKLASCIGNRFDLDFLGNIYNEPIELLIENLQDAIMEGLIFFSNQDYFFFHDRIQEAAYSMMKEDEKSKMHYKIGKLLIDTLDEVEINNRLLFIVDHLNSGYKEIKTDNEKLRVANLNLKAGKKAKSSAAFDAAKNYFVSGLSYLGVDSWIGHYELTLSLFIERVEASYLNSEFDMVEYLSDTIEINAKSVYDLVRVGQINVMTKIAQNKLIDAINVCINMLNRFNIKIKSKPGNFLTFLAFLQVRLMYLNKNILTSKDLPEMDNERAKAILMTLSTLAPAAFWINPNLWSYAVFKAMYFILKYGNTSESPYVFVGYGALMCVAKRINIGYKFGLISLEMIENSIEKEFETKVIFVMNCYVRPWKEHLKNTVPQLQYAFQRGLETGDHEFASLSLMVHGYHLLFMGQNLEQLNEELEKHTNTIERTHHYAVKDMVQLYHQFLHNLIGESDDPCTLSGDIYDEKTMKTMVLQHLYKMILYYFFGRIEEAYNESILAKKRIKAVVGTYLMEIFIFYDSLVKLSKCETLPKTEKKKLLSEVKRNQKKMKYWAQNAPENALHKYQLVEAEKSRIQNKRLNSIRLYKKAIEGAAKNDFIHEEALANELAAKFWISENHREFAEHHMINAYKGYGKWGARAKLDHLEDKYYDYIELVVQAKRKEKIQNDSYYDEAQFDEVDFSTVMKVSRAINSEIVLDKLLKIIMKVSIENAGAQKGFLVLNSNGELLIEASSEIENDSPSVLESIPVNESNNIASSIVHYVARTKENVLLNNASELNKFSTDSYIKINKPKSILCSPIINQGQLSGVLYLENNLSTGVFTQERLRLLNLLSSQAAIAIDNARLYSNLEDLVDERTSELKEAQGQVAQMAEVATGVLHNIGNILNSVNISNELILQTVRNTKISGLKKANDLFREHKDDLPEFLTNDPKGKILPEYFYKLEEISEVELNKIQGEATLLNKNIAIMRDIITTQQTYAKVDESIEMINLSSVVDDALTIHHGTLLKNSIQVEKKYPEVIKVKAHRSKVIHILLNLIKNSCEAMKENKPEDRLLTIEIGNDENEELFINVRDNGEGIEADNIDKMFNYGFTTKEDGHGFGLHTCSRFMEEMGGEIFVQSDGLGHGAQFTMKFLNYSNGS